MLEKVLTYRLPGDIPTIRYNRKCTLAFDNRLCSQTCVVFSLLKMRAIANFVYDVALQLRSARSARCLRSAFRMLRIKAVLKDITNMIFYLKVGFSENI